MKKLIFGLVVLLTSSTIHAITEYSTICNECRSYVSSATSIKDDVADDVYRVNVFDTYTGKLKTYRVTTADTGGGGGGFPNYKTKKKGKRTVISTKLVTTSSKVKDPFDAYMKEIRNYQVDVQSMYVPATITESIWQILSSNPQRKELFDWINIHYTVEALYEARKDIFLPKLKSEDSIMSFPVVFILADGSRLQLKVIEVAVDLEGNTLGIFEFEWEKSFDPDGNPIDLSETDYVDHLPFFFENPSQPNFQFFGDYIEWRRWDNNFNQFQNMTIPVDCVIKEGAITCTARPD